MCEPNEAWLTGEAVAILITGFLAVGGAFWIGRGQQRLQMLSLREATFERRMEVYDAVTEFLRSILRHADYPPKESEQDYLEAMRQAKFLFSPAILAGLDELWKKALTFGLLKKEMERAFRDHGHYGEGNPQKEHDLLIWFNDRFETLAAKMADETKLV